MSRRVCVCVCVERPVMSACISKHCIVPVLTFFPNSLKSFRFPSADYRNDCFETVFNSSVGHLGYGNSTFPVFIHPATPPHGCYGPIVIHGCSISNPRSIQIWAVARLMVFIRVWWWKFVQIPGYFRLEPEAWSLAGADFSIPCWLSPVALVMDFVG